MTTYRTKDSTKDKLKTLGFHTEELDNLSKHDLDELLEQEQQKENIPDKDDGMKLWDDLMGSHEVEIVSDETNIETQEVVKELMDKPDKTDFEWHDYVMQQFHDEELMNGYPKVNGLRRLVEKFIGPIITTGVEIEQTPCPDNQERASVVYSATVLDNDDNNGPITYTDAADCFQGNALPEYGKHPVALATTRAEARVLRKLLKLRTIAAEEQTGDMINVTDESNTDKITKEQIKTIMVLVERLNIDVNAMLNHITEFASIDNIINATNADGKNILKLLSTYQGEPETIPEGIKEK